MTGPQVTKPLSTKLPSDEKFIESASHDAERMGRAGTKGEVTKFLGDLVLHGELYLDSEGTAHFICHTPGDMTFEQVAEALQKFIILLVDQVTRRQECPFHT